jgi:hypothetical protein
VVILAVVNLTGGAGQERDAEHEPKQIELPFRVTVCAWCRPGESAEGPVPISHGICPRHFRQMLLNAHASFSSAGVKAAVSLARDSHRPVQVELTPLVEVAA